MDFNITLSSLQRIIDEESLNNLARLQELSEPSGLASTFPYSIDVLVKLKKDLNNIYEQVEIGWSPSSTKWQAIDAEASVALHKALRELPRDIAMSKGFWRYLSVYLSNIILLRYAYQDVKEDFDKRHFGEEIFNSLLPRLWFRAELSIDEQATDPYWLTIKGVSDFWSSFVLRRVYAQSKPLVRSLVKYFFVPSTIQFFENETPITTLEAFRMIGPAVRRQHSLSPFELMDEPQCFLVLDMLATELMLRREESGN